MAAPMGNDSGTNFVRSEVRKLRKKLRQIENLERLDRPLTEDEEDKVYKKFDIRNDLQELLSQCSEVSSIGSLMDPCLSPQDTPVHSNKNTQPMEEITEHHSEEESTGHQSDEVGHEDESQDILVTHEGSGDYEVREVEDNATEYAPIPEEQNKLRKRRLPEGESQASGEPSSSTSTSVSSLPIKQQPEVEPPKKAKANAAKQKTKGKEKKLEKKPVPVLTKEEKEALKFREAWKHCPFRVRYLDGHNDTVLCVATDGNLLISGGRDTMVKVWDTDICSELKSCGGHTGTITALLLLTEQQTRMYAESYEMEEGDRNIISGSTDCSIKLWSLKTGHILRSIYTYNSMTALGLLVTANLIVSGSDGGKLELWNLLTGENILSRNAHEDAINCIKVTEEGLIYTASRDCLIKIWEYKDATLHVHYVSEVVRPLPGISFTPTPIRCLLPMEEKIIYGDEGFNIKILNWKKGLVTKVRNHTCEFGMTDCLDVTSPILVASGFDLDNAHGYLNVYNASTHEYLGTLNDENTSRILCLGCTKVRNGEKYRWVTGGDELKVWDQLVPSLAESQQEDIVDTVYDQRFLYAPDNSDYDSDTDSLASDGEVSGHRGTRLRRTRSRESSEEPQGWFSWCAIL